jgi:hypothetical protein
MVGAVIAGAARGAVAAEVDPPAAMQARKDAARAAETRMKALSVVRTGRAYQPTISTDHK